jgi:hypothetical protein
MKYIGNYFDKLPAGFIDTILNDDGEVTPVYQPEKWQGRPEYDRARIALENAGYPGLNYKFHQYTESTTCIKKLGKLRKLGFFPDDLDPNLYSDFHWWAVKYKPGDMQPMHFDPHIIQTKSCVRYTMMLTDFVDGHIFVHDNYMLNKYRAGDLFRWPDAMIYHGAANIAMVPRISLQLSYYTL